LQLESTESSMHIEKPTMNIGETTPSATATHFQPTKSQAIVKGGSSHRLLQDTHSPIMSGGDGLTSSSYHKLDVLGIDVYRTDVDDRKSKSRNILRRINSSKLGLRRKSISYPDLFEGDISNTVYKKSLYLSQHNTQTAHMDEPSDGLTLKIDKPTHESSNLQQKLLSHWFFKKSTSRLADTEDQLEVRSGDPTSIQDPKKKSLLANVIKKHFTAAKDFRQLNIAIPQSM